ncbi:Tat pathway signal sequence domain protein [Streptomyces wuyuanensis]|uniref:Tat pathway signal sequence domain protein n=1 Tax=Streptomyces wuyuanensis TaxID=1196353 RepID=UPI00342C6EC2
MSGVGPVEPGECTYAVEPAAPPPRRARSGKLAQLAVRHRRFAIAAVTAAAVAAGSVLLWVTRPRPDPGPWPAQAVSVSYGGAAPGAGRTGGALRFSLGIRVDAGPPVTVESIRQPSPALGLTASPNPPVTVKNGSSRTLVIVVAVRDCKTAPRNAGLPFLDVTLRNARAKQDQSFILGDRYARDLARVVADYCERPPRLS